MQQLETLRSYNNTGNPRGVFPAKTKTHRSWNKLRGKLAMGTCNVSGYAAEEYEINEILNEVQIKNYVLQN